MTGEKFQKEEKLNKKLPYYEQLCVEADFQLSAIKAGLGQSVLLRDIRPALLHWVCELDRYIYLYGWRFSKADHIGFVRLVYQLVVMPTLELRMVKTFARLLTKLLEKRWLLSRDDIQLDWRPLYNIYVLIAYKDLEEDGVLLLPQDMLSSIETLIRHARVYFPLESQAEMLAEFRPYMCPWDMSFVRAACCYNLFLTTNLPAAQHPQSIQLWLDEVLFWWMNVQNDPPWEGKFIGLLARLAKDNIGLIDWNPHLPEIFTKLLRGFGLKIVTGADKSTVSVGSGSKGVEAEVVCQLLTSIMGGKSDCLAYISRLFKALESYYHPSNFGSWSERLMSFLQRLPLSVCQRVMRERRTDHIDWTNPIPDDCKLTDKDLREFVSALLPSAVSAIYYKVKSDSAVDCIRGLATLCPELVLPAVLERVNDSFDTLTEPHRLLQSLNCFIGVLLPVLRPKYTCKPGLDPRLNVFPLISAILPGMDPNDAGKSLVTFQVISLLGILIPMTDCSDAIQLRSDLNENEKDLCSATANVEPIVNQFLDKIFSLVENSGRPVGQNILQRRNSITTRFSPEETVMKSGMFSSLRSITANCDSTVYQMILARLLTFVEETVLEGRIAAEMVGELCYAVVRTNAELSFPKVFNILVSNLKQLITEDLYDKDDISEVVLWWVTILSQICRCDGAVLAQHHQPLMELLKLIDQLKAKSIYEVLAQILEHLLGALCSTYTNNFAIDRQQLDQNREDFLPIRHWAEPCDSTKTELVWHSPNEMELKFANDLIDHFVVGKMEKMESPQTLPKGEILRYLTLMKGCVAGSSCILPWFDGDQHPLVDSHVDMCPFDYVVTAGDKVLQWKGANMRRVLAEKLHSLMEFLLSLPDHNVKPLLTVAKLLATLLFHRGAYKNKYDAQVNGLNYAKKILTDKTVGQKSQPKALVVERAFVLHNKRLQERVGYHFTETHLAVMRDLLQLSTSGYSEVRKEGQRVLDMMFTTYPYSYKLLLADLVKLVQPDPTVTHEQFKGSLYVLGHPKRALAAKNDWDTVATVWPAVIRAQHSEKQSIIDLLDNLHNTVIDSLESFQIETVMSAGCESAALQLWKLGVAPRLPSPTDKQLADAKVAETSQNEANRAKYFSLVATLVQLSNDSNLHWRHEDMAQSFLSLMLRMDVTVPRDAVTVFTRLLTHDSLKTRKMAVAFLGAILKLQKPKSVKIVVDLNAKANGGTVDRSGKKWGFRVDNQWLQYTKANLPGDAKSWDEETFVDKTHWGLYCWPNQLKCYAPLSQQPNLDRNRSEVRDEEIPIFDAFNDGNFVLEFLKSLSFEEKKGEDKFHTTNFSLFKGLFRNFGDSILPHFQSQIESMLKSPKETDQRVAAEFISGVIQGSRKWPYAKVEKLREWLAPLFQSALDSVTTETFKDWGTAVATGFDSRDPRKLHWLIEILFNLANKPIEASFNTASRFYFLQGGINQLEWRVMELWSELFKLIKPLLAQPYQNLRDRLGSCLSTIFWFDLPGITTESIEPNRRAKFLAEMKENLSILWKEIEEFSIDQHGSSANLLLEDKSNGNGNGVSDQRKTAILLLKTLVSYLNAHWSHSYIAAPREILDLLPLLCHFENETSDEELKKDCHTQLIYGMGKALLHRNEIGYFLEVCKKICSMRWWKARVSGLHFLRVSIFSNFFLFNPAEKKFLADLLIGCLQDSRIEVRQAASETLSGFLHCRLLDINTQLIEKFRVWARSNGTGGEDKLILRHAGVLGLSAIVQSAPYSVPPYLPEVLMVVSRYANERQPIQGSVKKILSEFKRTHHDSWAQHKIHFNDDQLAVLTDLLVSPNYYV